MEFQEMLDFLKSKGWKIIFRNMNGKCVGLTDYDIKRISLDVKICYAITDTMIHEYLHVQHDRWPEKRVKQETKKIMDQMTEKEAVQMAKQIFRRIPW